MKSIQTRITIIFSSVIIAVSLILSIVSYKNSFDLITKSIGSQAKIIAERAVSSIDLKEYEKIIEEGAETPYYSRLR